MKVVSVIWAILRGLLWALADEFPLGGRKQPPPEPKDSPWWAEQPAAAPASRSTARSERSAERPEADTPAAARASAPSWWPAPASPAGPPTIKVETDAGSFIASTTFSGHHMLGVRPIERSREEGESRRRRRPARPAAPPATPGATAVELREPSVPRPAPSPVRPDAVSAELREPAVPSAPTEPSWGDRRQRAEVEPAPAGAAVVLDPREALRVAGARRVRSRFGPADRPGQNLLATTLATRIALTASTSGSPPGACAAARMGDSA